jgi:glycosyltransferase involved in cell wall biosynthesis
MRAGVAQYTINLFAALAKIDHADQFYFYVMKLGRLRPEPIHAANFFYRYIPYLPLKGYSLLHRILHLPPPVDLLSNVKPDIAIFPNFVAYPTISRPSTIIVIHDLTYLKHPELCPERNRKFLTSFMPASVENASRVVAVSEHTKKDIMECYGTKAEKIAVIPNAVDLEKFHPVDRPNLPSPLKEKNYILFVSTLEPRKNVAGLVRAYRALPSILKERYCLVLAGGRGWKDEAIQAEITAAQAAGEAIITLGYTPDEQLPAIYSGASLFVYPSLYEGFGIPPLEAMACGVPVITANNSSLPEVVGSAAVKVDANDQAALTAAMTQVLTEPKLAADLKQRGFEQVTKYSWAKSAQKLLDLLSELA